MYTIQKVFWNNVQNLAFTFLCQNNFNFLNLIIIQFNKTYPNKFFFFQNSFIFFYCFQTCTYSSHFLLHDRSLILTTAFPLSSMKAATFSFYLPLHLKLEGDLADGEHLHYRWIKELGFDGGAIGNVVAIECNRTSGKG